MSAMRFAIAAGGTGGHLFPAEAVSRVLAARGHHVRLLTDPRTAARAGAPFEDVHVIEGAGLVGKSTLERVRAGARLARGGIAARRALAAMQPDAIIGFGGYPSVMPVLASRSLGVRPRVVLHDQNAVLGRANRTLSRFADAVATSFSQVAGLRDGVRTVLTGNPVRDAIAAIGPYSPPDGALDLLVLGGSLGARVFSDVVPGVVASLGRRVRVWQQARAEDVDRVRAVYATAGVEAEVSTFFADVAGLLARAHLVIARAGGSTVAELAASGRPALLVPLPIAAGDEQSANARALVEAGGAWMVRQSEFDATWLARHLALAPSQLEAAAGAARTLAQPNAAFELARLVEGLAASRYDAKRPIRKGSKLLRGSDRLDCEGTTP